MSLATPALPTAAAALTNLILACLDRPDPRPLRPTGLPAGAVDLLDHNLVIATTPVTDPRLFRQALHRTCAVTRRDVVLIRHGFHPEVLDPVEIDLAIRTTGGPLVIEGMRLFRHYDGHLHLIPRHHDLFGRFNGHGLDLSMVHPWDTSDECDDGLCHAAAEIVRAGRGSWS